MQKRVVIIAKGEVQRVGYRDVVERAARNNNLTGMVLNIEPYDVMIICEGDMENIERLINQIRIKKYPIEVKHLDITFEDVTGEFTFFKIKRGDMTEELGERLDVANSKMSEMVEKQDTMIGKQDTMIGKQDTMIGKQDTMIEKQDTMIGKQDTMIGKQDTMIGKQDTMIEKQDTMIEKQDTMIEKQDTMIDLQKETIDAIKNEGEKTRDTITSHISQEVADIRYEIENMKSTLAKVVEKIDIS